MTIIHAWQHIYAHVERGQSPQRERGFQTLFYSHDGLSEEDIRVLERRVFFDVRKGVPYKRQYYPLSRDRVVVAQAVPLPEPDQLGRGGRYLFHSLVFDLAEWRQIGCQPFAVFARQPFLTQLEAALERGDLTSGNIEPVALDVTEPDEVKKIEFLASSWSNEALIGLGWLVLRATELLNQQKRLAVVGSQDVICHVLELAFLLATPEARRHCSFDTYFHRSDPVRTPVWMAGFESTPGPDYFEISPFFSLDPRLVTIQPRTPFEHWWLEQIEKRRLKEYVLHRDLALAMDSILRGEGSEFDRKKIRAIPATELASFSRANAVAIESQARKMLSVNCTSCSSELITRLVLPLRETPERWWQFLTSDVPVKDIAEHAERLYPFYPGPTKKEIVALEELAKRSGHKRLLIKIAFWKWREDPVTWKGLLGEISEQDYHRLGSELLRHREVDIFDWFCEEKADVWLSLCLPVMSAHQVLNAATYLVAARRGDLLELLIPKIEAMSHADRLALVQILDTQPDLAPQLRSALSAQQVKSLSWTANLFDKVRRRKPSSS